ncbi:hypothetical protein DdX_22394 [Ditylenchus destructor]|uniref:Uncharacterized protein n=1 Tax=Ditylenchus destructor TaxID=166010 RepID=A0AAD4MDM6_9BILA|nr:hypothetical protein DdX_22394 [Ditylenchus destructor]
MGFFDKPKKVKTEPMAVKSESRPQTSPEAQAPPTQVHAKREPAQSASQLETVPEAQSSETQENPDETGGDRNAKKYANQSINRRLALLEDFGLEDIEKISYGPNRRKFYVLSTTL